MELLTKVMKYLSMFQSKHAPESQNFAGEAVNTESDASVSKRLEGARVAAIAAALHHHAEENDDKKAKVAAIVAALHHHELENNAQNKGMAGIAALVAAIHHQKNKKVK